MAERVIFVVGVGRSGTSLVQSMLAAHPKVSIPPETAFLRRYVAKGVLQRKWKEKGMQGVARLLNADDYFRRTGIDAVVVLKQLERREKVSDGMIYRAMLETFARKEDKPRVGDKDPRTIEFLGLVQAVFQDPYVIHVIRDPRDVLLSKKQAAWSRKYGVLRHIFANRVQMKIGRSSGMDLFGSHYYELIYERLISDPEGELRKLCNRIGLEYDSSMLDFGYSAKRLVSDKEVSWKKETFGPLLRQNKEKWKKGLSGWEIALTELVCGPNLDAGCYVRSGRMRQLAFLDRIRIYGIAVVIFALDPVYRVYRKLLVQRSRRFC